MEGGLRILEERLKLCVGAEIDGLIRALPQCSKGDATVDGSESFFLKDGVCSVRGVTVFWNI